MPVKELTADSPRILIVDDEELVLNFLHDALDTEKYSLHQARNGHAALAAVALFKPDVILLDLGLPDMNGIEVIRQIRIRSLAPIIVISVQSLENIMVSALDVGADDYLIKPFGVYELRARIRALLRRPMRQATEPLRDIDEVRTGLSPRERQILFWIKEGKSNWEIAVILDISERTVKFHIRSIMQKLNAMNRSQALAIAIKHGMINME